MPDLTSSSALALASASLARIARALLAIPLKRILAAIARGLLLPLRIALLPLPRVLRILAIPFAPLLYLLSYIDATARRILSFIASLEPIYTFLGTAAAVGFFAGIALAASSSLIASYLSIHDDPPSHGNTDDHNHHRNNSRSRHHGLKQPHDSDLDDDLLDLDLDLDFDEDPGSELRHQPAPARRKILSYRSPPARARRRFAAGLLSQTILEEDDDSDF